ncbi:indolepyruvate ferredoxin oxidoreductase subunit alpha [bacterium]|nr:indolepyruvate ferredoxin oxidoreductase subunit alpha [bacterium]
MRYLLSGNEAVALGCREAGVHLGAGYPGTPSTEILETIARMVPEMYVQWSPNEKVGLEVAAGAAFSGARALSTQKHVGLNVAADPLMTLAYTGVEGGLVVVTADDPELHSSQNEQDNRHFARFAKLPMLEPSDSQEAKDYIAVGMDISEEFDVPVLFRMTTRISHSKGIVEAGETQKPAIRGFTKNPLKYVMVPGHARPRHAYVEERLVKLRAFAETSDLNRIEWGDKKLGIVSAGAAYVQAREKLPEASFLKLGMSYPLPLEKIRAFAEQVDRLLVIEELDPFFEEQLKAAGIVCEGKNVTGLLGELTPGRLGAGLVREGMLGASTEVAEGAEVLPRPPVLCPGCPHRGVFFELKKQRGNVFGDIGCYTLGALPPLSAMDTCLDMGASIGNAIGASKVSDGKKPIFATIGDGTFLHSGMTGLLDAVYNRANITVVILDNRITAMTGGQEHPSTGHTLMGEEAFDVDLEGLVRALGVEHVENVMNHDLEDVQAALQAAQEHQGVSVILAEAPCALMPYKIKETPYEIIEDACTGCRLCLQTGCPSISLTGTLTAEGRQRAVIDTETCTGCGLCPQTCNDHAIMLVSEEVTV